MSRLTHAIWDSSTQDVWMELLSEAAPNNRWSRSGSAIKGCCVYHDDKTPSAYLNLDGRYYKCFGCGTFEKDPTKVLARALNVGYAESFTRIKERLNLRLADTNILKVARDREKSQTIKRLLAKAMNTALVRAASGVAGYTNPRYTETIDWLKARGVDDGYHALPLGLVPTIKQLRELLNEHELTNDCVAYFSSFLKLEFLGYLVFVYHSTPTEISRFRIRKAGTKQIYAVNPPDGEEKSPAHFFGMGIPAYLPLYADKTNTRLVVVEGEFDQLAFAVNQYKAGMYEHVVLSIGGGELSSLDSLLGMGFKEAYLLPDTPDHMGDKIARNVLMNTKILSVRVFEWSETTYKDPDEMINKLGWERAKNSLLNIDNYLASHVWARIRASNELKDVGKDEIDRATAISNKWGDCLHTAASRDQFIRSLADEHDLSAEVLEKAANENTSDEELFVVKVGTALCKEYVIVACERTTTSSMLHLWNKRRKTGRKLALARPRDYESIICADLGSLRLWMKSTVGVPEFLAYKQIGQVSIERNIMDMESECLRYVHESLKQLSSKAPNFDTLDKKAQGIHYIDDDDGKKILLVVNGDFAAVGRFTLQGTVSWEALEHPVIGDVYVELNSNKRWSNHINSVRDLQLAQGIDIKATYEDVRKLIDVGWSFTEQKADAGLLAAVIMAAPISAAIKRQPYLFVTAEASSGKSRLTMGLFGGTLFPEINVLEHSVGMDDFTEAGMRQTMDGSSLMLCLDEFEDTRENPAKSKQVRAVLKTLRNSMMGENKIIRGTTAGVSKVYSLRFPAMMSAIRPPRDAADISRLIKIEMKTDRTRIDPLMSITEVFSAEDMEDLRRKVTLGLINHIPEYIQAYESIERQYARGSGLPPGTQTRFREGLYSSLAVMRLAQQDYRSFAWHFCETRSTFIKELGDHTEYDAILDAILYSPAVRVELDGRANKSTTVIDIIASDEMRDYLNTTGCGVYYYNGPKNDNADWIIVNWPQAIQGVLSKHPEYRMERNAKYLRDMANRSKLRVSEDKARRSGITRQVVGRSARKANLSFFDISSILNEDDVPNEE